MLPLMMLPTTDLATFASAPNSADLLPEDALEPVVAFADLLAAGLEPLPQPVVVDGRPMPVTGNGLPQAAGQPAAAGLAAGSGAPPPAEAEVLRPGSIPAEAGVPPRPDAAAPARPAAAPAERPAHLPLAELPPETPAKPRPAHPDALQQAVRSATAATPAAPDERLAAATPARPQPAPDTAELRPPQPAALAAGALAERVLADAARLRPSRPAAGRSPQPAAGEGARLDALRAEAAPQAAVRSPLVQPGPLPTTAAEPVPPALDPAAQSDLVQAPAPGKGQGVQVTPSPLPSTPAPASAGPATAAQAPIDVPVRDTAWSAALGERVVVMANHQLQNAEIRLTPAELGPLRVQVAVEDGAANVTFHAQHALTREAIELALPRLRELLAENGLTLNQADVGDQGGPGVEQGNREAAGDRAPGGTEGVRADEEPAAGMSAAGDRPRVRSEALVDTFA